MSEKRFTEAKQSLALSQNIRNKLNQPEQVESFDQPQDMPPEAPTSPQEAPQEQDVAQIVQDTMAPYMEEIKSLIEKQGKETKEVEVKIEGSMKPKEEEEQSPASDLPKAE